MRKLSLLAICLLLGSMYIAYAQQLTEPAPHRSGDRTAARSNRVIRHDWLKLSRSPEVGKSSGRDSCCPPSAHSLPVATGSRIRLTSGEESESGSVELAIGEESACEKAPKNSRHPSSWEELARGRDCAAECVAECASGGGEPCEKLLGCPADTSPSTEVEPGENAFTILERFGSVADPSRECSADEYQSLVGELPREGMARLSDAVAQVPVVPGYHQPTEGGHPTVLVIPPGTTVPGCLPGTVPGYASGMPPHPGSSAMPFPWTSGAPPLVCSLPGVARVDRSDESFNRSGVPTPPHRTAAEEKIFHLLEAAEHLEVAGNHPLARQIRGQVREMQREQQRHLLELKRRQLARLEEEIRDLEQSLQRAGDAESTRELVLYIQFLEVGAATLRELELVPRTANDVAGGTAGRTILRAGGHRRPHEHSAPQLMLLDAEAGVLDELDRLRRAGAVKQLAAPTLWTRSGQRARFFCGAPLDGHTGNDLAPGMKLEVLPRLLADGRLLLEAVPEVTRALPRSASAIDEGQLPDLKQYRVHTRAHMDPGQTLLITLNDAPGEDAPDASTDTRLLVQIRFEVVDDEPDSTSPPAVERLHTGIDGIEQDSECDHCGLQTFRGQGQALRTAEAARKRREGPQLLGPAPTPEPRLPKSEQVDLLPPPMLLNLPDLPELDATDDREPAPPALPEIDE